MTTSLFDLHGKVALVTGGYKGLGLAMATGLGEAGAKILLNGRKENAVNKACEALNAKGVDACAAIFDVTDYDNLQACIDELVMTHGGIDILINNAGIIAREPLKSMPVNEFQRIVDTDLTAPFAVAQAVYRHMKVQGHGKIINICSMMSELGRDGVGAYAAAKGGLKMLTRNLATEWARDGIQVNGIGPGYFATDITAPIRVDGHPFNEFIINRTPTGRWGDPSELKGTAVFLASKASDFVNGQVVYVDGGILATIGKPSNEV
ncbi:gluconate 5-dehydrogenase [Glaciecola sp. KUL10]|uniref:gluconate 5-dehydrogenase n=1 Tax=Glaciecola sp. (strain KUL10) TaxID=2161813 RepID=UPI000D785C30|nr:gluconate 5-dehydrogenase [Glaciecola sp. KUL10]GBL05960.1 gluconate 5-dehydrogenase [Glaciecola sp. KUL10]